MAKYDTSFSRYQVVQPKQQEPFTPSSSSCNNNHFIEKEFDTCLIVLLSRIYIGSLSLLDFSFLFFTFFFFFAFILNEKNISAQ